MTKTKLEVLLEMGFGVVEKVRVYEQALRKIRQQCRDLEAVKMADEAIRAGGAIETGGADEDA